MFEEEKMLCHFVTMKIIRLLGSPKNPELESIMEKEEAEFRKTMEKIKMEDGGRETNGRR